MLRAIIFDIGGVLVRTENLEPRRVWERRFGLPEWGLAKVVFEGEVAARATIGQATLEDVWEAARQRLQLSPADLAQLRDDFWKGDIYDESLFTFLASLRPEHKTGIISNAWPGVREAHQAYINPQTFDVIVYSQEEGLAKPDPEIYQRALRRLEVAPAEAVFVDDVQENVVAAQNLGMAGIRFVSREQTLHALQALLS